MSTDRPEVLRKISPRILRKYSGRLAATAGSWLISCGIESGVSTVPSGPSLNGGIQAAPWQLVCIARRQRYMGKGCTSTVFVNAPLKIGHERLQHSFLCMAIELLQRSFDVINRINPVMLSQTRTAFVCASCMAMARFPRFMASAQPCY